MRDEEELQALVDYVHINPLEHGLVTMLSDRPHSSFHRDVRNGWLPHDWVTAPGLGGGLGER